MKPLFKDYEYGWYGLASVYRGLFFSDGFTHLRITESTNQIQSEYVKFYNGVFKQLPKLKGVVFIYGNYKTVI